MGGPDRARSPASLTSLLGLETAGRKPAGGTGTVGHILLTLCHLSLRPNPPGNYRLLPGFVIPALIGTDGLVVFTQLTHTHHRNKSKEFITQISSPQIKPRQHCGERLLDSSCVLSVFVSECAFV